MVRLLLVSATMVCGVVVFLGRGGSSPSESPGGGITALRETVADTTPRFRARLQAGADCGELMALRDTYDPVSPEVARMTADLRAVGCDSPTSTRIR